MDGPELRGERVTLVGRRPRDMDELRRIRATSEVGAWWPAPEEPWASDSDPEELHWTVLLDDRVIGAVDAYEEPDDVYRSANIDLYLDPRMHGQGFGSEVVRTVARWLFEDRGHHRLTIDPATANTAAVSCYLRVGFKPVGVMRQYERDTTGDGWHDSLLMDMLPTELT